MIELLLLRLREGCEVLRSACLSVCLSVPSRFSKPHVHIFGISSFMLPVAVARSFFEDSAIDYALPVLWTRSCFQIRLNRHNNTDQFVGIRTIFHNTVYADSDSLTHQRTTRIRYGRGEICYLLLPC